MREQIQIEGRPKAAPRADEKTNQKCCNQRSLWKEGRQKAGGRAGERPTFKKRRR